MSRVPTERLRRIDHIFQRALDRPAAERSGYLARICRGDESLRYKVGRLLSADARARTFLERPYKPPRTTRSTACPDAPRRPYSGSTVRSGESIGPYRLIRPIGQGGMSKVYLAVTDGEKPRRVALKVLRRGLDDADTLSRFRREGLMLAQLRHPNVTRFLGRGTTTDGRPYMALEYVEGWPIDEYCDRRRLDVGQRLELFRAVCAAVQYAHRRHLVHRDLKPDNILVTADGTPKLLDFGIAKVLDRAMLDLSVETTLAGVRLMTPGYASPEQVLGGAITPASDIYSLGVVLCHLLAGLGPYRSTHARPLKLGLAICHQRPLLPSAAVNAADLTVRTSVSRVRGTTPRRLCRRLRGDLDAIVARALDKIPEKRYAGAAQLAHDIVRHLEHRPVRARRATIFYRAGKLVARHRGIFMALTILAVTVLGWLAFMP